MSINVAYVGPVNGRNSLSLVLLDNTEGVQTVEVADLSSLNLQQGPSMCQGDTKLHIFVTDFSDYSLHEVLYHLNANRFEHVGPIPGVKTADRTAAVFDPNTQTMQVFYQDSNVLKQAIRTTGGSWTTGVVQGAARCDWGPSACTRGGAVNLAFTSNNGLKVGYIANGILNDISPTSGVSIWWSPALIDYQTRLFAIFGWQNTNNLNCIINSEQSGWRNHKEINSYNCVDAGPSACIFNNSVFCFSQGSGNRLLYTVYTLESWPDDNADRGTNFTSVRFKDKTIDNVYYAPAAVSIG